MPKERKTHKKWPAYVHEANGRIVYRPRVNGKFITPVRIGKVGMSDAEVWSTYNEIIKGMEPEGTLGWLVECFWLRRILLSQRGYWTFCLRRL